MKFLSIHFHSVSVSRSVFVSRSVSVSRSISLSILHFLLDQKVKQKIKSHPS
jgi:hypothetical protein